MKDNEGISLEAHILHDIKESFYGKNLKIALLGFLRPEMKFSGVKELLSHIQTDVGLARNQLKDPELLKVKDHAFFS